MKHTVMISALLVIVVVLAGVWVMQQGSSKTDKTPKAEKTEKADTVGKNVPATISFGKDVMAIIQEHCLPCHSENEYNPSELFMDSYDLMAQGGKHGVPWIPGKPGESLIVQKLGETPPFDARMPLNPKKKIQEGKAKWLSPEEISTIAHWIEQGSKNN